MSAPVLVIEESAELNGGSLVCERKETVDRALLRVAMNSAVVYEAIKLGCTLFSSAIYSAM